jgi:general stress protein 26
MPDQAPSVSWAEFREQAPDIAQNAATLFSPDGEAPIAFMATVSESGRAHLSPVNPVFCGDDVYLSAGAHTPKSKDLATDGSYVLHAFLGASDEEFQVSGHVELVTDEADRTQVHEAIQVPSFDPDDPIFRLLISRALSSTWVLDRDPQAIKKTWRAG